MVGFAKVLYVGYVGESCYTTGIHPLYIFIAVYIPVCTLYTCIYTIYTPLNTTKHPIKTLYTPYIHYYTTGTLSLPRCFRYVIKYFSLYSVYVQCKSFAKLTLASMLQGFCVLLTMHIDGTGSLTPILARSILGLYSGNGPLLNSISRSCWTGSAMFVSPVLFLCYCMKQWKLHRLVGTGALCCFMMVVSASLMTMPCYALQWVAGGTSALVVSSPLWGPLCAAMVGLWVAMAVAE